ncbi:MAG TPA: L,D-transpeptidase [Acidimicrobiales bacterium]|nr:L,D-transpeptidase [Acidimicrobiales bacterium]
MRRTIAIAILLPLAVAAGAMRDAAARPSACAPATKVLASPLQTFAARVTTATHVYRSPGRGAFLALPLEDPYGFPTTLSVLALERLCNGATWYRVQLAHWPNGTTGWVRSVDVATTKLRVRIVVDVSAHQLTLYRAGHVVLRTPAAIGKPSTPTPLGTFFVTQRFVVDPPTGAYGPRALGISAFSNVLRSWRDGGPIGIHGTDETFSIGRPVSHGCIRLPNDVIIRLFAVTPLGTPVVIQP